MRSCWIDQFLLSYDLSILDDDDLIFQTSGVSNASGHNMIEFDVPDDVTGVITLQFENLNGSASLLTQFSQWLWTELVLIKYQFQIGLRIMQVGGQQIKLMTLHLFKEFSI